MLLTFNSIVYKVNQPITAQQYIELLLKTSLGARRPVQDIECIEGMLKYANVLITAWQDNELVGVSRSVTDFHFCCYLSDLAVSEPFQKEGIGKTLIELTSEQLKPGCKMILLAAPQATHYYPKLGFVQHPSAWLKTFPAVK